MTSRRPVIGITTHTLQSLPGIPPDMPQSWVMSQRYILALTAAGALPWLVPLLVDDADTLRGIYEELAGVFLPGGLDVDPTCYGEVQHPRADRADVPRDRVELMLTRWALEDRKPVLGVCRGVQVMNIVAGGTLYQDLSDQRTGSIKHDYFPFEGERYARDFLAHEVRVAERTRLAQILGVRELKVNSMHHQGIKSLGRGLVPAAVAPDGVIEATESGDGHFFIGVQWHPEALADADPRMRRIFQAFVDAASEYRERRVECPGSGV
jgi:putative glutamine amidotransferase